MAVRHALAGCLYAGDDLPDLDAFAALDRMAGERVTVKVAVRTEETPGELIAAADVVVDRPAGLLRLLSGL
jgi:trehalose 6-phosphate phosphatase